MWPVYENNYLYFFLFQGFVVVARLLRFCIERVQAISIGFRQASWDQRTGYIEPSWDTTSHLRIPETLVMACLVYGTLVNSVVRCFLKEATFVPL